MKKLFSLLSILSAALLLAFLLLMRAGQSPSPSSAPAVPSASPAAQSVTSVPVVNTSAPEATPEVTPEPTPEPEPESELFTISFIGDLTLTGAPGTPVRFEATMNGDYLYPFSNVVQYFSDDEYTIGNLECTFSDQALYSIQTFSFRAPTTSANILLQGGVDFVTTANNHTEDFHEAGKRDTWATLEQYGIPYGKNDEAQIVTTPNGLRLGIYCQHSSAYGDYRPDEDKAIAAIHELKEQEPDLIICAFHMGIELNYYPLDKTPETARICRRCIDEGADIIYGSHTHCLQPIEEYNGGLILYSMGNFVFGGSSFPSDQDTAIVQLTVSRDKDGKVAVEGYDIIPCCISSLPVTNPNLAANVRRPKTDYNDFRPTPYEPGSEDYNRALSKINGTYDGPDGQADYSDWHSQHP